MKGQTLFPLVSFCFMTTSNSYTFSDAECNCCDKTEYAPMKMFVDLSERVPSGGVVVILFDPHCDDDYYNEVVKTLSRDNVPTVTHGLEFVSNNALERSLKKLKQSLDVLQDIRGHIYIFTFCMTDLYLLSVIEELSKTNPWLRWVTIGNGQNAPFNRSQLLPMSSCRLATVVRSRCSSQESSCSESYVIRGPESGFKDCRKEKTIGRWKKHLKLETWLPKGFLDTTNKESLSGKTLIVSVLSVLPFFVNKRKPGGELKPEEGIDFEILKTLSEYFGFSYKLYTPSDGHWGHVGPDGKWTGMVGMVYRKEADIAISDISMTIQRERVIDFTYPYFIDPTNFLTQAPTEKPRALAIIRPFTYEVWISIGVALLVTSLIVYLLTIRKSEEEVDRWTMTQAAWYFYGALTQQGGAEIVPIRNPVRVIVSAWWIFAIIITAGFSGTLTSFMNVPGLNPAVDTVSQLISLVKAGTYKGGTRDGTSVLTNFEKATEGALYVLGQVMIKDRKGTVVKDFPEGVYKVLNEPYALIFPQAPMEAAIASIGNEKFHFSSDRFFSAYYAVVVPKGSPLRKAFDDVLTRVREAGLIPKWNKDILERRRRNPSAFNETSELSAGSESSTQESLSLDDMIGAFCVLALGYTLGFLLLLLECIVKQARDNSDQ